MRSLGPDETHQAPEESGWKTDRRRLLLERRVRYVLVEFLQVGEERGHLEARATGVPCHEVVDWTQPAWSQALPWSPQKYFLRCSVSHARAVRDRMRDQTRRAATVSPMGLRPHWAWP